MESKIEKQYKKWIKSKKCRLKNIEKELDEIIQFYSNCELKLKLSLHHIAAGTQI